MVRARSSVSLTSQLCFVQGRVIPTVSASWNASDPIMNVGTWPVSTRIGMLSINASVRPVTASSSRPRAIFAVVAPLVRSPRGLRRGLALVPGVIAVSARDTTSSLTSVPTMETVPPSLRLMAMGVGRGSRQMPERWARIGGKGCTHPSEGPTGRFVARAGEGYSPRRASPRGGGLGRQLAHQAAHRSSSPRASRVARNGSPVFFTTSERQQLVRTSRSPPSVVIS